MGPSAEKIAQAAQAIGLLDERQLQDAWGALGSRNVSSDDFLQFLVRREYLTNYQVERLLKGDRNGFFYGDYKVLYHVGAGTFRVYRAVHRKKGRVVAVKVLRNRFSEDPIKSAQFIREGKVGCTLRHPNIVAIYDVVSEGHKHYMVMEFVEGRSLRDFVKIRKKLDPTEATRMVSDIAAGLHYASGRGLTHRDLKMTNVLVSSTGQAKLVDFGLAGIDENINDELNDDVGNDRAIDYAALERSTGVRKDDARSDLYFLGCIYYNMLTGVAPLSETRDRVQRLNKNRFLEVVPIKKLEPTLPDAAAMVVAKSMSFDPAGRYQTAGAMLADLRLVARRLAGGNDGGPQVAEAVDDLPPEELHSVMVVESDPQMQDIFRKGFKRCGFRVLLTADPVRALSRLQQDETPVECIVMNAQSIGLPAVEVFNKLADDKRTQSIATVLLLDENQLQWRAMARPGDHHAVLQMPVTMKTLRETLARLLSTPDGAAAQTPAGG